MAASLDVTMGFYRVTEEGRQELGKERETKIVAIEDSSQSYHQDRVWRLHMLLVVPWGEMRDHLYGETELDDDDCDYAVARVEGFAERVLERADNDKTMAAARSLAEGLREQWLFFDEHLQMFLPRGIASPDCELLWQASAASWDTVRSNLGDPQLGQLLRVGMRMLGDIVVTRERVGSDELMQTLRAVRRVIDEMSARMLARGG